MPKENDPTKHNKLRRAKNVLVGTMGCMALTATGVGVLGAGAKMAWSDRSREAAIESVQERTNEEEGTKEVVEVVSLQDVRPVTGYTIEHRGMEVERDLEKEVLGVNVLRGNSVSVEVDIDSKSQVALNLEKLNEVEVAYDSDTETVTLQVSYEDLIVSSHEDRSSRNTNRKVHGPIATVGGVIDVMIDDEDKKLIQDTQNDLETLAVNLALQYADEHAVHIVNDTRAAFEEEISEVVIYEMGLNKDEVEVVVDWADTDSRPEIEDEQAHLQKIQELGGTVTSGGEQERVGLPSTGGKR